MARKLILAPADAPGVVKINVSACATDTCEVSRPHWHTLTAAIDSKGLTRKAKNGRQATG